MAVLGPYFALGLLSLMGTPLLLLGAVEPLENTFYRHPAILAALHVYVLGWGTAIALGALQQMVPVLFGAHLYSGRMAQAAFYTYLVGLTSLVVGFFTFRPPAFMLGGLLVPLGVGLALLNVGRSLGRSPGRAGGLVRPYVRGAGLYLAGTVVAGAALAVNLVTGWLGDAWVALFPLHVTFGLAGWFLMLIVGISYHLLPFFGLTPKKRDPQFAKTVRWLLHGAILTRIAAAFWPWATVPLTRSAYGLFVCAIGLFLYDTRHLFAKRAPHQIHPLLTHVRIAYGYLGVLGMLLVAGIVSDVTPRLLTVAGVLATVGWLGNTVLGYLYRILPFFVWHNKYWDRATEPGVPAFRDMVASGPAWLGLALYNAGVLGLVVGLLIGIQLTGYVVLLGVGSLVSGGNLVRTMLR